MQRCASCHEGVNDRAPRVEALGMMSPKKVYAALTTGPMVAMATGLSDVEKKTLVEYLTGQDIDRVSKPYPQVQCKNGSPWFDYARHPRASGWGIADTTNTRFIPAAVAQLPASDVGRLKLKWAFSFPNTFSPRSQPAVAGGAVFVGDNAGNLYALDAKTGCVHWTTPVENQIRTAFSVTDWAGDRGRSSAHAPTLYFGDGSVHTYAVNAVTGKVRWKTKIDDHPFARLTGAPTLQQSKQGNRLYVPVSSNETMMSPNPQYPCCTFRGSVTALDAETGEVIWKTYVIPTAPTERSRGAGIPHFGPSGAGVWDSPTLDEKRGRLYVGTGENHVSPVENGGAVVALGLSDGAITWVKQIYAGETYNESCAEGDHWNCPPEYKGRMGLDVSASPLLLRANDGKDILVAANKPGDVLGLDPDQEGKILWRRRISRGDYNWGVLFGMAVEGRTVFAGVHNKYSTNFDRGPYWGEEELGLYAMDGFTGEPIWTAPVSRDCHQPRCQGYAAALTAIPGVVFAGAKDGYFRAFDSATGKLIWEFNTAQTFQSLNGQPAHGGALNGPGAVVVDGMVFLNSGYPDGGFSNLTGNVFLAFSVDGK